MKLWRKSLFALLGWTLLLSGCAKDAPSASSSSQPVFEISSEASSVSVSKAEPEASNTEPSLEESREASKTAAASSTQNLPDERAGLPSAEEIADYSGQLVIEINNDEPFFEENEWTTDAFQIYMPLDSLGRAVQGYASLGEEIQPEEERGDISSVHPTGWVNNDYSFVDGGKVYNRCHLIAFMLSGQNANERNLITGTRTLNVQGMLPLESQVDNYIDSTGNHVMYRVTPLYAGDDLVAKGVLMEAKSVEDNGAGISFCRFVYNVEPGVAINYATGDNQADGSIEATQTIDTTPAIGAAADQVPEQPKEAQEYVLNTNTHKFHYPWCSSVSDMKAKNRSDVTESRDVIISQGYVPCKRCNP